MLDFPLHSVSSEHANLVADIAASVRAEERKLIRNVSLVAAVMFECQLTLHDTRVNILNDPEAREVAHDLVFNPIRHASEFKAERDYLLALVIRELASVSTYDAIDKHLKRYVADAA